MFDAQSLQQYVNREVGALLPPGAKGGWLVYIGTDGVARYTMVTRVGESWQIQGALEYDLKHGEFKGGLSVLRTW